MILLVKFNYYNVLTYYITTDLVTYLFILYHTAKLGHGKLFLLYINILSQYIYHEHPNTYYILKNSLIIVCRITISLLCALVLHYPVII